MTLSSIQKFGTSGLSKVEFLYVKHSSVVQWNILKPWLAIVVVFEWADHGDGCVGDKVKKWND